MKFKGFLLLLFLTLPLGAWAFTAQVGQPFPDWQLLDPYGNSVSLSQYKGKVLLIEPVGMNCQACQALTGAHKKGPLNSVVPQKGLKSIEDYLKEYGDGLEITDSRLVFIQIIFYNNFMQAPKPEEVQKWVQHFQMDRSPNFVVLAGTKKFIQPQIRKLIPGFFLVDKNFVLRFDSTTERPKHNLYQQLIPNISKLF